MNTSSKKLSKLIWIVLLFVYSIAICGNARLKTDKVCTVTEFDEFSEQDVIDGKVVIKTSESDLFYPVIERSVESGLYSPKNSSKGSCDDDDDDEGGRIFVATSHDPNDIIGPAGYGDSNYVSVINRLPYTIRFENDPEFATAPAQEVFIEQFIDPDLNIKSYKVGNFGFADYIFEVPSNKLFYQTRIDLRDSLGIYLDFVSGVETDKNRIFWILRSIDPETGMTPEDPFMGFLHVNDSLTHAGEGFVSYTILPNNTDTGTKINAEAEIVFDVNAPIKTPNIMNTLDSELPKSKVSELDSLYESYKRFLVSWGSDYEPSGSGIKDYTIYVSKNKNPYQVWLENTTETGAVFEPYGDGLYSFYSLARSNVGLQEKEKNTCDAETLVGGDISLAFNEISDDSLLYTFNEDTDLTTSISNNWYTLLSTAKSVNELDWKIADNDFVEILYNADSIVFRPLEHWYGKDSLTMIASYEDYSDSLSFSISANSVPDDPEISKIMEDIDREENFDPIVLDLHKYFWDPDPEDILYFTLSTADSANLIATCVIESDSLRIYPLTNKTGVMEISVTAHDEEPVQFRESGGRIAVRSKNKSVVETKDSNISSSKEVTKASVTQTCTLTVTSSTTGPYLVVPFEVIHREPGFREFTIDLDYHFSDRELQELSYSISHCTDSIEYSLDGNLLTVGSKGGWVGSAQIEINAKNHQNGKSLSLIVEIVVQEPLSASLEPLFGSKTIYIAIANYADKADEMKTSFVSGDGAAFKVIDDSGSLVPVGDLAYSDYIESSLEHYFHSMTNGLLDLDVEILKSQETNGVWRIDSLHNVQNVPLYMRRSAVLSDLEKELDEYSYSDLINSDKQNDETVFINYILPYYGECGDRINGNNTETVIDSNLTFDKTVRKLARHLSQTLLAVGEKGYTADEPWFDGYIDGNFMGRAGSQTGPYDLMFKSSVPPDIGPYSLYGLNPIHTDDLIRSGYFEGNMVMADETNSLYPGANSYSINLHPVRDYKSGEVSKSDISKNQLTARSVKIPISVDPYSQDDKAYPEGSMTKEQYYMIEYRQPAYYDEISPADMEGESGGILISHVINSDAVYPYSDLKTAVVDIVSATPYPEGYFSSANGLYYNGRIVNDWLDDFNETGIPDSTFSRPEDFFNDADRNKFTPLTRPSTSTWKNKNANFAVFIDSLKEDYAVLRIYRNYYSKPVATGDSLAVEGIGYFGETFSVESEGTIVIGSQAETPEYSSFTVLKGTNLNVAAGSTLKLMGNTDFIIEEGAELTFENGSHFIIEGNVSIKGKVNNIYASVTTKENSVLTIGAGTPLIFRYISDFSLIMRENSQIMIESGSSIKFDRGSKSFFEDESGIFVNDAGSFNAFQATLTCGEFQYEPIMGGTPRAWTIINGEIGSSINIEESTINGGGRILNATASTVNVTKSTLNGCLMGLFLTNCKYYTISENSITGTDGADGEGQGIGISLTHCYKSLIYNTITNFEYGVMITQSQPILNYNTISGNKYSGLYITGHNSLPDLAIKEMTTQNKLNNTIIDNNEAQILMRFAAGVNLEKGHNNIYHSDYEGQTTTPIPCIRGVIRYDPYDTEPHINRVVINAGSNYWGNSSIDPRDQDFFFRLDKYDNDPDWSGYFIDYEPYNEILYGESVTQSLSSDEKESTESRLLTSALMNEWNDNSRAAIKIYEVIIKKYEDTPEYYVASSRLPNLYAEEEESLDMILKSYDEAIDSDVTNNKKFYEEMRISGNIKAKYFEKAIIHALEMKEAAQSEDEVILAEINILIAQIMSDYENGSKVKSKAYSEKLDFLLQRLGSTPVNVATENIPTEFMLYQNYPNPFNPATTIKFDIPKESHVRLTVYNVKGEKVSELLNSIINPGYHRVEFDASRISAGIYYYTLELDNSRKFTKRMLMIK